MLLTKEVEIKLRYKDIEYYENFGYEIPKKKASESYRKRCKQDLMYDLSKPITIKVEHLLPYSHVKVQCLCDLCKNEIMNIPYNNYTKEMKTNNGTYCKKCGRIFRKETCKSKYGVEHPAQSDVCKEKTKATLLDRYGVESFSQTDEFKEKRNRTCKTKYGEDCYKQFSKKGFNTFKERTGYNYPSQSPEVKEKIKQSLFANYGVDNPNKSYKIREKTVQTLYGNSSQKSSIQQRYICELFSGILNFPVKYYNVDIYLSDDNLICEYDGGGHMLNVSTGRETVDEYKRKEIIRDNVIKNEGYKQMKIISSKDYLPSDEILLQMLSQTKEYFSNYPNHSWIEFNIDTSTVRNAEQKEGSFFNYGELRKIKKSDLEECA